MRRARLGAGPAFCLLLLVLIGCGGSGGQRTTRGKTVFVTSGAAGADLPTATAGSSASSAGSTSGDTTATTGDTAGTGYVPPSLGDAAIDVTFASDGAPPTFERMSGTGEARGFTGIDYDYTEDRGDGGLDLYGHLDDGSAPWQEIQCAFEHKTFVKVGTKLRLTYGVYYGHRGYDDWSGWEGIEGGTAEVVAMGPGLSVTVRLDGLRFRSLDDEKTILTLSGTVKSPADPPVYAAPVEGGTTGTGVGTTAGVIDPSTARGHRFRAYRRP